MFETEVFNSLTKFFDVLRSVAIIRGVGVDKEPAEVLVVIGFLVSDCALKGKGDFNALFEFLNELIKMRGVDLAGVTALSLANSRRKSRNLSECAERSHNSQAGECHVAGAYNSAAQKEVFNVGGIKATVGNGIGPNYSSVIGIGAESLAELFLV